ncbi:DUF1749 domain-containing protein [Candidatus Woesearchaeota archaeon]|nr:DUF1749 domain-containing protein [Candidatus Woesearchaeota archaeon]
MKVYIIHRWDGTPKSDWYPWLKKELEKKGFEVITPEMPNTSEPEINQWVSHLNKIIKNSSEEIYLIGHSIGCQAIMRYLTTQTNIRIRKVIFVSGWFTLKNLEDKESEKIAKSWIETPIEFNKIKNKAKNITVFLSDNDPFVNLKENKEIFEKNLNAKIIVEKNKGHFTKDDGIDKIPEVLEMIK